MQHLLPRCFNWLTKFFCCKTSNNLNFIVLCNGCAIYNALSMALRSLKRVKTVYGAANNATTVKAVTVTVSFVDAVRTTVSTTSSCNHCEHCWCNWSHCSTVDAVAITVNSAKQRCLLLSFCALQPSLESISNSNRCAEVFRNDWRWFGSENWPIR